MVRHFPDNRPLSKPISSQRSPVPSPRYVHQDAKRRMRWSCQVAMINNPLAKRMARIGALAISVGRPFTRRTCSFQTGFFSGCWVPTDLQKQAQHVGEGGKDIWGDMEHPSTTLRRWERFYDHQTSSPWLGQPTPSRLYDFHHEQTWVINTLI